MCRDAFSDLLPARTLMRDLDNLALVPWGTILPALAGVLLQIDHQ